MSKLDLAAVIVAYHPTRDMAERARAYAEFLAHVVVVDNTDGEPDGTLDAFPGTTYLRLGTNRGMGHALNIGVSHSATLGFHSVLLLDQDSVLTRDAASLARREMKDDIGIVALRQVLPGRPDAEGPGLMSGCVDVRVTMTSGSILNMQAFRQCGDFEAKLFIDYVDHDYCLRLRRAGYRIVQCLGARLDHELGEPKTSRFLGASVTFITHEPFRSYYMVRNGLYVIGKYFADDPTVGFGVVRTLLKELLKALLFENHRLRRLRYMSLGARDWLRSRYGRVEQT